jgi:hypothetical protein
VDRGGLTRGQVIVLVVVVLLAIALFLVERVRVDGCNYWEHRMEGPGDSFDCVSRM